MKWIILSALFASTSLFAANHQGTFVSSSFRCREQISEDVEKKYSGSWKLEVVDSQADPLVRISVEFKDESGIQQNHLGDLEVGTKLKRLSELNIRLEPYTNKELEKMCDENGGRMTKLEVAGGTMPACAGDFIYYGSTPFQEMADPHGLVDDYAAFLGLVKTVNIWFTDVIRCDWQLEKQRYVAQ